MNYKISLFSLLLFSNIYAIENVKLGDPKSYELKHFKKADLAVETEEIRKTPSADLLTLYTDLEPEFLKVRIGSFLLQSMDKKEEFLESRNTKLKIYLSYSNKRETKILAENENFYFDEVIEFSAKEGIFRNSIRDNSIQTEITREFNFVELAIPHSKQLKSEIEKYSENIFEDEIIFPIEYLVVSEQNGKQIDNLKGSNEISNQTGHCAFVLHGNQGLTYTDVFRGTDGGTTYPNNWGNGFDELMAISQTYGIPANYHMSGTLITAAEWHDPSFNDWLAQGGQQGWAEIMSSAYGQHIMPFLPDNVNSKSVKTQHDLVDFVYNYNPSIAWVPERVWLSAGNYPEAGISDSWLGDNWTQNGIDAIVLDDYIHLPGADNHKIHWMSNSNGINLRVIPIDNTFTGNVNYDAGQAWNTILSTGANGITVYGTDWEVLAEVSGQGISSGVENFEWLNQQLSANSAWQGAWKLSTAISSGQFDGTGVTLSNGTYDLIGGTNGYGGNNNSWYTDWANTPSHSDYHSPKLNYGTVWWNTYNNLMSSAQNSISEAGWYTFMINIHETAWHDGLGQPISGWIHKYSGHIKNANVYAEASKWAAGWYTNTNGCYTADVDQDGLVEMVIHNDRIFAVFEATGGRLCWMFGKGSDYAYPLIGSDHTYWEGTDGDFNDANHIAGLSDSYVNGNSNWVNESYGWNVDESSDSTVQFTLFKDGMEKRIRLSQGEPYLRVNYKTPGQAYIKSGFSPDFVALTWDAQGLERIFSPSSSYFGQRKTGTNATAAYVVGSGGASHSSTFSTTLIEGDEIQGNGEFEFYLYGGYAQPNGLTSPDLDNLATQIVNRPKLTTTDYFSETGILILNFDDQINVSTIDLTNVGIDSDFDSQVNFSFANATLLTISNSNLLRIQLDQAIQDSLENSNFSDLRMVADWNVFTNNFGNGNERFYHFDYFTVNKLEGYTKTIDGFFEAGEWDSTNILIDDPNNDSFWGVSNEIETVFVDWDSLYLYLGIDGSVGTNISWLLYLDTDPNGSNGETNLSNIDVWDRNANFSVNSLMKADFQFGSYAGGNGDFWKIESATATSSVEALSRTFLTGSLTGTEIAIPWSELYGLGNGIVEAGAEIRLAVSLASQNNLGGDSAPSNTTSFLPTIDNSAIFTVDGNNDGFPDLVSGSALTVDFIANPTSGNLPLEVEFVSLAKAGTNPIQSWSWDFDGNGTTDATGQSATHIYNSQGSYTVSLTVSDGTTTLTETKNNHIDVALDGIDQDILVTFQVDLSAFCNDQIDSVKATGTFTGWNAGSGALNLTDTDGDLIFTGNYLFQAGTVENQEFKFINFLNGNVNPNWESVANRILTLDETVADSTLNVVFFNDTYSSSISQNVEVSFQIDLSVVTDNVDSVFVTGEFFGWNPTGLKLEQISGTVYGGSNLFAECSDGEQEFKFLYHNGADFVWETQIANRTLQINDSDSTQVLDLVTFNNLPISPQAGFSATPLSGNVPLSVDFTDLSIEGASPIISWEWDFDSDGTIDKTDKNPNFVFNSVGNYDVTLIVSDGTLSDTLTKVNYIAANQQGGISQNVEVDFSVDLSALCAVQVDSVKLVGTFTNWPVSPIKMEDLNNDNVYEISHTFTTGDTSEQEYKFIYYSDSTIEIHWENEIGNRLLSIDDSNSDTTLATVFFNENPPTNVTTQSVDVTFQVDVSSIQGNFTNIFVTGSFADWKADSLEMNLVSGTIYDLTVNFPTCSDKSQDFKFTYFDGTNIFWENTGNRSFTIDDSNNTQTLDLASFGDVLTQNVNSTFRVNMFNFCDTNLDSVKIAGDFTDWLNSAITLADSDSDFVFEGVHQFQVGDAKNREYKFIFFANGDSTVQWESNIQNRTLQLNEANGDTILEVVNFDDSPFSKTSQNHNVYFQVHLGGVQDNIVSAYLVGTFNNWDVFDFQLTQLTDDIFGGTYNFPICSDLAQEYKFIYLTSSGATVWEDSIGNRQLTLDENQTSQTLDLVTFNDLPIPLEANFVSNVQSGNAPLSVDFTDLSFSFPDSIQTWSWDFDNDGVVDDSTQNPTHIFTSAGTYSVRLAVFNGTNSDDTLRIDYITVSSGILPAISDLQIQESGNDIVLSWSAVSGGTNYKIYREATPITDISGLTPIGQTTSQTYTDSSAILNEKRFYVVTVE